MLVSSDRFIFYLTIGLYSVAIAVLEILLMPNLWFHQHNDYAYHLHNDYDYHLHNDYDYHLHNDYQATNVKEKSCAEENLLNINLLKWTLV